MRESLEIIAEIGINHNGHEDAGMKLIEKAAESGVDAVKFQIFVADQLVNKSAEMSDYQKINTGQSFSQYEMLERYQLGFESFVKFKKRVEDLGLNFLATPFDLASLDFLRSGLGATRIKISSGDLTNLPFLFRVAKMDLRVILSTGMALESEVLDALFALHCGYVGRDDFLEQGFFSDVSDTTWLRGLVGKVQILHCTSEYPAPLDTLNLNVIKRMRDRFGLDVGYSDHSEGVLAGVLAAALGASILEKHFTLDNQMEGPDHRASLNPEQMLDYVTFARQVSICLGQEEKTPSQPEKLTAQLVRKSLVASANIRVGDVMTAENISIMRPGDGMHPRFFGKLIGRLATRDYYPGDLIFEDV